MDIDPKMSLVTFVQTIAKRLDGVTLIILICAFAAFAAFPSLVNALGLVRDAATAADMRLAFLLMPAVLVAEYVWFLSTASSRPHSFLICAVLVTTAAIPFFKSIKDSFQ